MLDGRKLKLSITLERSSINPGDSVLGSLKVDVSKDVELTAIRLRVQCKETATIKAKKPGNSFRTEISDERVHFRQLLTFFGHTEASGRKGDCELSTGTYTYPFEVVLPPDAVPSAYVNSSNASCVVAWSVKAYAVIPNGFDKTESVPLTVYATVADAQHRKFSQVLRILNRNTAALVNGNDSCSCCRDATASASVQAALYPPVVVVSADRGFIHPAPPPDFPLQDVAPQQAGDPPRKQSHAPAGGYQLPPMVDASVFRAPTSDVAPGEIVVAAVAPVNDYPGDGAADAYNNNNNNNYNGNNTGGPMMAPGEAPRVEEVANPLQGPGALPQLPGLPKESTQANTLVARVDVSNLSRKEKIGRVRVTLRQRCYVTVGGFTEMEEKVLGEPIDYAPGKGFIAPMESATFFAVMRIGCPLRLSDSKATKASPLPTLKTAFLFTNTLITVSFPKNSGADTYVQEEVVYFVSAIDYNNRNPPIPATFTNVYILPERQM